MRRYALVPLIVAVAVVVAFWLSRRPKTPGHGGRSDEEIAVRLRQFLDQQEKQGCSGMVLVIKGEQILCQQSCGLADRESQTPFRDSTVFTVGSITKQFTGAAIMKLVMQDRLRLDDTIDTFFDDVPEEKRSITVHHLLTHTSGLPGSVGDDFDTQATSKWIVREAMDCALSTRPGEKHRYSNLGYSLLGVIIEKASGQTYEAYLRENLFEPSAMRHTGYILPEYDPHDLACGYRAKERWGTILDRPMLEDGPGWNLRANGGIHTTIEDVEVASRSEA